MANFFSPKKADWKRLGTLQKFILDLAREQGGEVLARDVLMKYYGFIPRRSPVGIRGGCMVFNKSSITGYNAATVAVCKAFNRLISRGFAWKIHGGIKIKWSR